MKKTGALLLILLLLITIPAVIGDDNVTTNSTDNSTATDTGGTTTGTTTTTAQQDPSKIGKAFTCLENQVANKCSTLSVEEIALTVLASPDNVLDECVGVLKGKMNQDGGFGSVKDTALAVLALDHTGQDTDKSESWLLNQTRTPTDLIWYLEQDSNEKSECTISYDGSDYRINVAENKKIDSNAGSCLTRAVSNFWLRISSNCLNKEFLVSCDKDFITTLLYKQSNSPTIYVLPDTQSEPAFGTTTVKVNSRCFGSSSCDYEASAWATYALLKTGHDIEVYIPYLIAGAGANEDLLPGAFIYLVTNYNEYAEDLVSLRETGNYWEADSTEYNKFYDTALAVLALQGTETTTARDWLLFQQATDGCWKNSNSEIIRDTAFILWALEGRAGSIDDGGVTYCSEANFFCIPIESCPEDEIMENYFCSGLSSVCCENENLQPCADSGGEFCGAREFCDGNEIRASDGNDCCLGSCGDLPTEAECEQVGYICKSECSDDQEELSYDCDSGVCCRTKTTPPGEGWPWWVWLLIVLIVLLLGFLVFYYREKLQEFWVRFRNRKGKGGGPAKPGSGGPSRPGFPPILRPPMMRQRPTVRQPRRPIDNTFEKLRQMTG